MHEYELVTILSPEIRDEDVAGTIDRINQFIAARGGEIQNIDQWGRRKLAYPIARQFEGTYVVTLLRLPPAQAVELEANLSISEDILRHLLVRYSPSEAAAALAATQRRRPQARPAEQPEDSLAAAEQDTASQEIAQAESAEAAETVQEEARAVQAEPEAVPVQAQAQGAEAEPEAQPAEPDGAEAAAEVESETPQE